MHRWPTAGEDSDDFTWDGWEPETEAAHDEPADDVWLSEDDEAEPTAGGMLADVPTDEHGVATPEAIREALKAVIDPEIGINIIDLGLVYEVETEGDRASVKMTLTSMGCPMTELLHQQVSLVLTRMPGVRIVNVDFTFTPPWSTEMISDDARDELRAMGFAM